MDLYNIVFIIANAVNVYTIFRFFCIFFTREDTNKPIEIASYVAFCIIGILIHFFVTIPIIMLTHNFIGMLLLTLNYKSKIKKRLFVTGFVLVIFLTVEMLISFLLTNIKFELVNKTDFSSVPALIIARIVCFSIALIIGNIKLAKEDSAMPRSYWVSIIFLPVASVVIALGIFETAYQNTAFVAIASALILLINFIVFSLYHEISKSMQVKLNKQAMLQQNNFYQNELSHMQNSWHKISSIRHDMQNHLTTMYGMLKQNDVENCMAHIEEIMTIDEWEGYIVKSRNIVIDSIINYKLQQAAKDKIALSVELDIPQEIDIPSFDIAIILGNLIDNALEAVMQIEQDRLINISITLEHGFLVFEVENSFNGNVKLINGKLSSAKRNYSQSGIGIKNINSVVSKYNGSSNFWYNDKLFYSKITLYLYKS